MDTRQWASKHNKPLAHKDKPLVQNKQGRKAFCKMASDLPADRMKPLLRGFDGKSSSCVTQAIAHFHKEWKAG